MIKLIWQIKLARYLLAGVGLVALSLFCLVFFWPTRIFVYNANWGGSDDNLDVSSYIFKKSDKALPLSADVYLITDLENEEVVVSKNEKKIYPIASITKLMTALVAGKLLKPDQLVTISPTAYDTYGNSGHLRLGEQLSAKDLIYPLLLSSSNDAAEALAEAAGRNKFLAEMNIYAREIGLNNTFFADPSGLSPANTSTADDLAKLVRYLYYQKPEILAVTREKEHRLGRQIWRNANNIALMKYYVGGKNGYTEEADRTLVSIFQIPIESTSTAKITAGDEKKSRLLALVLLQSDNRQQDTRGLINYLTRYVSYLGGKNGFIPITPSATSTLPKA